MKFILKKTNSETESSGLMGRFEVKKDIIKIYLGNIARLANYNREALIDNISKTITHETLHRTIFCLEKNNSVFPTEKTAYKWSKGLGKKKRDFYKHHIGEEITVRKLVGEDYSNEIMLYDAFLAYLSLLNYRRLILTMILTWLIILWSIGILAMIGVIK